MLEKFKHVFLVLGVMLCMNATVDHELVKLVSEHVTQLSADVDKIKFKNQKDMDKLGLQLKNIEQHLQTRIEKLKRAQDVLQQEQTSTALKVDELITSQNLLQLHQSSNSAKVDVLQHEMDTLHLEQSCTAVKFGRLQSSHEASLQRITDLESQKKDSVPVTISYGK